MNIWGRRLRALLDRSGFAAHQLGAEYATRSDEPKDQQKALKWYGYGAKLGDLESMYDLGFMTLLGEGRPADKEEALRLLRKAAAGGHETSQRLLSDIRSGIWTKGL